MKNIKCRNCFFYRNEWCEKIVDSPDPEKARDCNYFREMTNADRIRAMSDEELVSFLMRLMGHAQCFAEGIFPYHPCPQNYNCKQCGIDWLQQPAEEDDHDERKENENV